MFIISENWYSGFFCKINRLPPLLFGEIYSFVSSTQKHFGQHNFIKHVSITHTKLFVSGSLTCLHVCVTRHILYMQKTFTFYSLSLQ